MKRRLNLLFNVLMIVVIGYLGYQKFVVNKPTKQIDFHELSLVDKEGAFVSMNEFEDKPIFLTFYSSWCAPCMLEMPSIKKLHQFYQDKEMSFLIVNTTSLADIQEFEKKHGTELPQYLLKSNGSIPINTIPLTYLINKNGNVVQVVNRPNNWNSKTVRKRIDKLLAE